MSLLEIAIIGLIIISCLIYINIYLRQQFKNVNNNCVGCSYAKSCKKNNNKY